MTPRDDHPDARRYGCTEYTTLSRRRFLGLSAGALAAAAVPGWMPRVVLADSESSERDVLVFLFLRGGADGLTLCAPFGEPAYYRLRPTLAVPPPDASGGPRGLDLDGFFAFPPALEPLLPAYRAGDLAVVHACGLEDSSRSHFEAMHYVEVGMGQPPADRITGWLGRHLAAVAPSRRDGVLRALALSHGLPRTLVGAPQALPVADPEGFGLLGGDGGRQRATLDAMYAHASELLATTARTNLATLDLLQSIDFAGYLPAGGATYPESELGRGLAAAAALIRADVGVEAITLDLGGWDTHDVQGSLDGALATLMADLAASLAAFHADLDGAGATRVTTVALSEFGRNAFENASRGTDHGHAGVMFVLGSAVDGGRVVADWPGLEDGQLYEDQDLAVTLDYRHVVSEILDKRLANPDPAAVFADPEYQPVEPGIVRRS